MTYKVGEVNTKIEELLTNAKADKTFEKPTVVRIRRKGGRVVQDCDLYIGRSCTYGGWDLKKSKWANPFSVKSCGSADEACRKYREYVQNQPELMSCLGELSGKRLGCWCDPKPCHGHVLVDLFCKQFELDTQ